MRTTSVAVLTTVFAIALAPHPTAQAPRWWKGNLHTHTLWSDGDDFPEQIADWYKTNGYNFLALSDHNVLSDVERWMKVDDIVVRGSRIALSKYRERFGSDWVETRDSADGKLEVRLKRLDEVRPLFEAPDSFLMIQSEEISDAFDKMPIHINATNVGSLVSPRGGTSVRRVIDRNLEAVREQAKESGRSILAHLNHPNYGWAVTAEDLASVLSERFFEVYNGHPKINHLGDEGHAGTERLWDIACTLRIDRFRAPPPFGLATDDSHHYFVQAAHLSNTGRGWVQVRAAELTPEAVVDAIADGDFYASTGVTLADVRFDGTTLNVEISPDDGAEFETLFIGTRRGYDRVATPVRGEDGAIQRATWRYSKDVGEVFARATGSQASYELRGDELYVRAVVSSTAAPANPSFAGQVQQAWTQPVGWSDLVEPAAPRFGRAACQGHWPEHLQGIDVDPAGFIYWSYTTALVKTNQLGAVHAAVTVPFHHGDVAFHDGRVYSAVNLGEFNQPAGAADSWVYVYDGGNLALQAKHPIPEVVHGAGGMTWSAGRFWIVGGLPEDGTANLVYEYAEDMTFIATHEIPGYTEMGIQTASFSDGHFWFGCYGDSPVTLVTDPDFEVLHRLDLDTSYGIAAVPAGRYLIATTVQQGERWLGRVAPAVPDAAGGLTLEGQ